MQTIITSPYTLLLVLTIVTIWYYEKSEKLTEITLPHSLRDGAEVEARSIVIPVKANPKAAIYYKLNGKEKSTLADYDGYAYIYHYFDEEKISLSFFTDKHYTEKIKELSLYQTKGTKTQAFKPEMVFDKPYYDIAKETTLNYFIEDDYILVDIKTPKTYPTEARSYVDYILEDFSYSLDLYKKENNIYQTIYRINEQIVEI